MNENEIMSSINGEIEAKVTKSRDDFVRRVKFETVIEHLTRTLEHLTSAANLIGEPGHPNRPSVELNVYVDRPTFKHATSSDGWEYHVDWQEISPGRWFGIKKKVFPGNVRVDLWLTSEDPTYPGEEGKVEEPADEENHDNIHICGDRSKP